MFAMCIPQSLACNECLVSVIDECRIDYYSGTHRKSPKSPEIKKSIGHGTIREECS